ncbi:hypothetical protein HUJ05_002627 [Dendroctonus ponderosae]|nr:hypothetical protein HUJ05_002627 [Dendroctonus ponderosae]
MNRIITLLAISVALSAAMSVPNVYHKTSNSLKQEQLAALINQLLREKQVYQEVKRECLRMGPLGCLNDPRKHLLTMYNPGKRCANFGDDGCLSVMVSVVEFKEQVPTVIGWPVVLPPEKDALTLAMKAVLQAKNPNPLLGQEKTFIVLIPGGVIGAASDSDWIGGGFSPGKRCANLGDEGCANGGVPGAAADTDWIDGGYSPGKRCANLGDEGCVTGGVSGAGSDSDWISGGFSPGKRCANLGDEGCANAGVEGAGSDADWLSGDFNPGRR